MKKMKDSPRRRRGEGGKLPALDTLNLDDCIIINECIASEANLCVLAVSVRNETLIE